MSRPTRFAGLTSLILTVLLIISLTFGIASSSSAADAEVVSFNAYRYTVLTTTHKIDFEYTAEWSGSNRECFRLTTWWEDDLYVSTIASAFHYTTPVSTSGTDNDVVHSEGTGNFYKIRVEVRDSSYPFTIYAYDGATDGEFDW